MVELGGGAAAKISPPFLDVGLGSEAFGFPLPGLLVPGRRPRDRRAAAGRARAASCSSRGPGVTGGLLGRRRVRPPRRVTEDGWLRTGDLARLGPFGTVLFEGRAKDVIKVGGYSVYALERVHLTSDSSELK